MFKSLSLIPLGLILFQTSLCANPSAPNLRRGQPAGPRARVPSSQGTAVKPQARKLDHAQAHQQALAGVKAGKFKRATFAGGCFWCMQPPFDKQPGVISTSVGYTGGVKPNPTYKEVARGLTKHTESIEVIYDPKQVNYKKLLLLFWCNINPTDGGGQFYDRGSQYRPAIFYHSEAQQKWAEASKKALDASKKFGRPMAPEITKAGPFYHAETYHQQYYKKSPYRYKRYRIGSGREAYIQKHWSSCQIKGF